MPADYLSKLPAGPEALTIAAFDPFQPDLIKLQAKDPYAREVTTWRETGKWPSCLSRK
jgi:hypothetical protein